MSAARSSHASPGAGSVSPAGDHGRAAQRLDGEGAGGDRGRRGRDEGAASDEPQLPGGYAGVVPVAPHADDRQRAAHRRDLHGEHRDRPCEP